MEATYSMKACKVSLQVSAVAVFLFLGMCFAPHVALASEAADLVIEPNVSYSQLVETRIVLPRSWYGDSLRLLNTQYLQERYFDGNNVGIEMTASSPSDGTFSVSLYRIEGEGSSFISSATFKRNGFTKATWEGVGPGTYRFVCKKAADGKLVTSSDVAMYSW